MADPGAGALSVERSCAMTAVAFSEGRRQDARLMSGERRSFGLNASRNVVHVPYPPPVPGWTLRTMTSGVALQCSPSKDRTARYPLHELSPRELGALTIVEGGVALGWIAASWPGLMPELRRVLPDLEIVDPELDGQAMLERALSLAHSTQHRLRCPALLGLLPLAFPAHRGLSGTAPADVRAVAVDDQA